MLTDSSVWRLLMVAIMMGGAFGCSPSDSNIVVSLSNLPVRSVALRVTGKLDGKSAMVPQTLSLPANNQLLVQLPAVTAGHLVLDIQALDSDQCTQGSSSPELDVNAGRNDLAAPIRVQSPRKCGMLPPCASGMGCAIPSGTNSSIRSIWTIAPNDIWAVGTSATVLHYDGNSWTVTPPASLPVPGTTQWNGVWASASNDVWVVGSAGRIIHYDGMNWTASASGAQRELKSISGVSGQSIWTVGLSAGANTPGEFWHWNGTAWTAISPFANGDLDAVLALNPNFIVVGGGDTNFNGILWSLDAAGKFSNYSVSAVLTVTGLWGSSPTRVLAAGFAGEILSFDGTKWTLAQDSISNDLHSVTSDGAFTYVVGAGGFAARSSDPALRVFTPIMGLSAANFWAVQLGSSGIVWFAGENGYLGYLDARP